MSELQRLRQEAHEVAQLGQAIVNEFAGKEMPAEKLSEANGYFDKVETIQERIKLLERNDLIAQREKQAQVDLPFNGGKNGRDDGEDKRERKQFGDLKAHGLGEQLMAVKRATTNPHEVKALGLSEGVASEGGFLVQQDFSEEMIRRTYNNTELATRVRRIPISSNSNGLKINAIDETSRAAGSRWGGIQAYWENEAQTITGSKPAFRQIRLDLKKLTALLYATDELLQDAAALQEIAMMGFEEEIAFKLDSSLFSGDGAGKPLGITASPSLVTVAKETGQAAATVLTENIVKMWSRMWAPSRANAVWFINQDVEPQLMTMTLTAGTGGQVVYMPPNGLADRPFATLMGRPVIPIEHCATLGTVGDIVLADMSQVVMIEKGGTQMDSSIHVQFLTAETTYRFIHRVDAQPIWNSALTPASGSSNTLSPFVALATRA